MDNLRATNGNPHGGPRATHGRPMATPRPLHGVLAENSRTTREWPMGDPREPHGVSVECPCVARGIRAVHMGRPPIGWLSVGCLWVVNGSPMGCP